MAWDSFPYSLFVIVLIKIKKIGIGPAPMIPILQVFNEDDQFLTVHDGDTLEVSSLVDSRMKCVFTDWDAYALATARDSKWNDPKRFIWVQPEVREVSFHWLTIKQESPSKYLFSIQKEKNDTVKEIIFETSSNGPVSHSDLYFKLE